MNIIVLGAGNVGRAIVETLHEEHDVTVVDLDAQRLAVLSGTLRRPHHRGRRDDEEGPDQGRRRRRGPVHRLQPARGGQPGQRDGRQAHVRRPHDHPHDQRRVPRGVARGPDRRRLHDLARARDGERGVGRPGHPVRTSHGRVRGRQGADRRVRRARRRGGEHAGGARAAQRGHPRRLARGRTDPRRPLCRAARHGAHPAGRPRGGHRVARRRARVDRRLHAQRRAHRRRRHLRRGPHGDDDRPRAAWRGACGYGSSTGSASAPPRPRSSCRRCAPSTRRRSTPSSWSASGSAARPPPSSRSTTTPRTSTAPCSPRGTACARRSRSCTTRCRSRSTSAAASTWR